MNKRIRELAEQCSTPGQFDVEKFSALLIKECLGACISASCSSLTLGKLRRDKLRDEGIAMCMEEIRKLRMSE